MIIQTEFAQSVPGIARLLQNSPGLKKLTLYTMHGCNIMVPLPKAIPFYFLVYIIRLCELIVPYVFHFCSDMEVSIYFFLLKSLFGKPFYVLQSRNLDQYWGLKYKVFAPSDDSYSMLGCNVATSKVLAWFMELVLRNAKTLETMVVWLKSSYFDDAQWFEEQLQRVGTLSHNNNVSILLKLKNYSCPSH